MNYIIEFLLPNKRNKLSMILWLLVVIILGAAIYLGYYFYFSSEPDCVFPAPEWKAISTKQNNENDIWIDATNGETNCIYFDLNNDGWVDEEITFLGGRPVSCLKDTHFNQKFDLKIVFRNKGDKKDDYYENVNYPVPSAKELNTKLPFTDYPDFENKRWKD